MGVVEYYGIEQYFTKIKEVVFIRVFFAIEFDDEVKDYIYDRQKIVKEKSKKGNFTIKKNIHLTLKFIGEVSSKEMYTLKKAVDVVVNQNAAFNIVMDKAGKFDRGNQSIVWVGIERNSQLEKINNDLEQVLLQWGYDKENRKFKPHITIGRQVVFKEQENLSQIPVFKTAVINKISLMESKRVDGVLTYVSLYSKTI